MKVQRAYQQTERQFDECVALQEERPTLRRKRKPPENPVSRGINKRVRIEGEENKDDSPELKQDGVASGISEETTCGPFHPGQFQEEHVPLAQLEEKKLAHSLARIIDDICRENEENDLQDPSIIGDGPPYKSRQYPDGTSSVFYSISKPNILLKNYIIRFIRYLNVSRSVFIVGLLYLARIADNDDVLALRELNAHRLITSAFCVAAKYLEDESHCNSSLTKIGGIPSRDEMNTLEAQFLRRLNWDCSVDVDLYQDMEENVLHVSETGR